MSMSSLIGTLVLGLSILVQALGAHAQESFPDRPLRVIVPYAPGGPGDTISRAYAGELSKVLNKPVVVDNRPGAGMAIGILAAHSAPATGYTLLFTTDGMVSTMLSLKNPGYRMEDFAAVAMLGDQYYVLLTTAAMPARDLKEFFDYARRNPARMNFGSLGTGTTSHVLSDRLAREAGFSWKEIAYRGAGPALQALMAGEVQGYFTTQSSAVALKESDKVRAMAIAAEERGLFLPELPTFKEFGYRSVVDQNWYAILTRSSVPASILARLRSASAEVMKSPAMMQHQRTLSLSPSTITVGEFRQAVAEGIKKKAEDLKRLGVVPQ